MLAEVIIESYQLEYSSPIVLAKKKDGDFRFCVDYRRINSITEDSTHTLPSIQKSMNELGTEKIFSILDLRSGNWQVPFHPNSRNFTAFAVPHEKRTNHLSSLNEPDRSKRIYKQILPDRPR